MAHAEVVDISDQVGSTLVRLTDKTHASGSLVTGDITRSPVATSKGQSTTYCRQLQYNVNGYFRTGSGLEWVNPSFGNGNYLYTLHALNKGAWASGTRAKVVCDYMWTFVDNVNGVSYVGTPGHYRYFVLTTDFTSIREITPDGDGMLTAPYNVGYLAIACTVNGQGSMSNKTFYLMRWGKTQIYVDIPDDALHREITQQTETLMDTNGSDTVGSDAVNSGTNTIENLTVWESIQGISEQLHQAVSTTETDTEVTFPGMSLMGFELPSASVDVWQYSPIPQDTVRGFLTFVFCVWYVRYMYALVESIFGLRFASYADNGIPAEAGEWTGASNDNWGLVE